MKIGIAGVGGIGSNVAMHFVRSGITDFVLVDFDRVEPSNLNRQFYFRDQIGEMKTHALKHNLLSINHRLNITTHNVKITSTNIEALFSDCGILVEGLDKGSDKKMFMECLGNSGKLLVSANGIAGISTESIVQKKVGTIHIVGDFSTDCKDAPLYSHKVMTVAASMAEIILRHLNSYIQE